MDINSANLIVLTSELKTYPLSASIYRYIDHPRSYEESIAECEMMSGQLATISTIPQLELLEKVITSHQFKRFIVALSISIVHNSKLIDYVQK